MSVNANRIRITQDRDTLVITIRAKRHLGVCIFLIIWLIGWACAWLAGVAFFLLGDVMLITLFSMVWLGLWTLGGVVAMNSLLWMLKGREVITVSENHIVMTRQMPMRRKHATYDMQRISNMRVEAGDKDDQSVNQVSSWDFGSGSVKCDHGGQTIGFGLALEAQEAHKTAQTLRAVFPALE